MIEVFEVE
jgi:hypothetical protein